MGDLRLARCLQGGGVFVYFGTVVTITSSSIYGNTAKTFYGSGSINGHVRAHVHKFPLPMGDSPFAPCLQGGGVFVQGGHSFGRVTISSCTISWNTADQVRAHVQK